MDVGEHSIFLQYERRKLYLFFLKKKKERKMTARKDGHFKKVFNQPFGLGWERASMLRPEGCHKNLKEA